MTANSYIYVAVVDCVYGFGNGISFDLSFNTQSCPDTNNGTYCDNTDGFCYGTPYTFYLTQTVDIAVTITCSKFGYIYCY